MRRATGGALALGGIAISAVALAQPPAPVSSRDRLRDRARLVLEEHCGQCHVSAYDSAVPRALAVFDLSELEWSARMTVPQLIDAESRVRDGRGPEGELHVTPEQVETISEFVRTEIARIGPE